MLCLLPQEKGNPAVSAVILLGQSTSTSKCTNLNAIPQAGKVKSQTPKVAPQEDKPKKIQGRAKKVRCFTFAATLP